jgi:hypothetical protein
MKMTKLQKFLLDLQNECERAHEKTDNVSSWTVCVLTVTEAEELLQSVEKEHPELLL